MAPRRCLLIALCMVYASAAWPAGDEDDLLAPLTPTESKTKKKKKKAVPPISPVERKQVEPQAPSRLAVRLPDSSLKDAHLFVDDKEVGVLPMEPVDATPGEHRVTVRRSGYAPFNATVKVKDSGVTELLATLEPVSGVVDFASDVVGVEVFIDGKSYGPVPVNDVLVTPGSHQLRAKREGYEEQTQLLIAKAGQDYAVRFNMKPVTASVARADRPERPPKLEPTRVPEPARPPVTAQVEKEGDEGGTPWFGQWYVWAGAGAVAAGAAAGAVFLLQPTNPCIDRDCDACINEPESVRKFCIVMRQLPFVGVGGPMP